MELKDFMAKTEEVRWSVLSAKSNSKEIWLARAWLCLALLEDISTPRISKRNRLSLRKHLKRPQTRGVTAFDVELLVNMFEMFFNRKRADA